MPKVRVNDIEMYYEVHGSGAPLVYIGGAISDLRSASMAQNPLVEHFRVLAYDQRGQGQTDAPNTPYTTAMMGDDAAGLMEATGFSPALVVGVSFGGMVAQELALRHPEKVLVLTLCCASSGGEGGGAVDFGPVLMNPNRSHDENILAFLALGDSRRTPEYIASHQEEMKKMVEDYKRDRDAYPPNPVGLPHIIEARQSHNTYDRLGQIRIPTIVLGGKYDAQQPPQNQERIAEAIPGAELYMFEGGHSFLSQDKEAAYGTIINYLRGYLSQPMFGSGVSGL